MTAVLVDSSVLLDVLSQESAWSDWSASALTETVDNHRAFINPIIYAEVSVRFSSIEDLEDALPSSIIERQALPFEAAFLAAKAFRAYRRRGGARETTLPDFFIGAHAAIVGCKLLTRDPTRIRSYFPGVDLISPS